MISVKNLCKSFGDHQVLKDINEHIAPGEKIVIIGPSGSGKSTFLRCMNLLERPTSGQIIFDGIDITDPKTDINKVRQHMGMVFQHFNLFPHKTIMENITLAPVRLKLMKSEEAKEEALRLLKLVNLEEKADAYPGQLSGGQKQRIAIAGIMAMHPSCMVLDEATAMLDPAGRREVLEAVHRLNKEEKVTVILITHHMDEAVDADRVLVMDKGQIAMDGTPKEVFSRVEELQKLELDVPQITELAWQLKQQGMPLSDGILTQERFIQELEQILQHRGRGMQGVTNSI